VGRKTITLDEPYCVMATQNPVEQEGTYPLPEAQLDRFLFKLIVGYPKESEYGEILNRTVGAQDLTIEAVSNAEEIMAMRKVVREVPVPPHVQEHAVHLIMATQPGSAYAPPLTNEAVALGSSPRGAQALLLAGKVRALLAGRFAVANEDVRGVALDALRHRVMVSFQGQAEGVSADDIVKAVLAEVRPE
jgi:MoxR-like ATPase